MIDDTERLAIQWRAETGIVPYSVWVALSDDARCRVGRMTHDAAALILATPRTTTPRMDAVALADLLARSVTA
jgi:hypothetical protein